MEVIQTKDQQVSLAIGTKQLVKPNTSEDRLAKEVESLCDGNTFCVGTNHSTPTTPDKDDVILF